MAKRSGSALTRHVKGNGETPQSEPLPGQVPNTAGGHAWQINDWEQLDRFLILGSEGGTYYISEQKLTADNAMSTLRCIREDGVRAVERIAQISEAGRAPKNEPAIFALSLAMTHGSLDTRRAAADALPRVCRIGTHLFQFLDFIHTWKGGAKGLPEKELAPMGQRRSMRGMGNILKRAVRAWYEEMPADRLAYQVVKYRSRHNWTHRDVLRLVHPRGYEPSHQLIYDWVTQRDGKKQALPIPAERQDLVLLDAFDTVQRLGQDDDTFNVSLNSVRHLIKAYRLPREALPTQWLNRPEIWDALLEDMPMTAMIRNLGNMSKSGLLTEGSDASRRIAKRLADEDRLRRARIHPIQILAAMLTYGQGHGTRGKSTWEPVTRIIDALDESFYLSFGTVEPTDKRLCLAIDVSGSMGMVGWMTGDAGLAGVPGLTPAMGAAVMALVTANVEKDWSIMGFASQFRRLNISPKQRLDDVMKVTSINSFGSTDCARPMLWALKEKIPFDAFCVYTDNETWFGDIHPTEALDKYNKEMDLNAKLVVVGMESNGFSIADPNRRDMLDIVGFDTATPSIISDFVSDRLEVIGSDVTELLEPPIN